MKKKSTLIALIIVMLILSLVFLMSSGLIRVKPIEVSANSFPKLETLMLNRKGNKLFKEQNFKAAFDEYVKALQHDPFAPELHLNIGLGYEAEKQDDKAATSYQNAYRYAGDGLNKFMALFNQAQLFGRAKKIDEALALYQQALTLNPASKEVKTNIELLIQSQQQEQKGKDGDKSDNKTDDKEKKDQDKKDQDKKDDKKDKKDNKDKKDDKKDDKGKGDKDKDKPKDPEPKDDKKDDKKDEKKPDDQPKTPQKNEKYKPRPFKGDQLSEADVKKILGEIKQQEQKIRSEFNRKDSKEQPRDKDW